MKSRKVTIKEWVLEVGEKPAVANLINGGFAPSTAEQIAYGRYSSKFGVRSIEKIKKAMAFTHYSFADESNKAS